VTTEQWVRRPKAQQQRHLSRVLRRSQSSDSCAIWRQNWRMQKPWWRAPLWSSEYKITNGELINTCPRATFSGQTWEWTVTFEFCRGAGAPPSARLAKMLSTPRKQRVGVTTAALRDDGSLTWRRTTSVVGLTADLPTDRPTYSVQCGNARRRPVYRHRASKFLINDERSKLAKWYASFIV